MYDLEFPTVPAPTTGAPRRREGGREAVCRFSRAGDGENGRSAAGMDEVALMGRVKLCCEVYGAMQNGMIGMGR